MVERIRDVQVADEIAAQAGTDSTPELALSETLQAVIFAPQRPPLASSGYYPGTIGVNVAASALNFSHIGIFGRGFGGQAVTRVNWLKIINNSGGALPFNIRRVDSPFTGFPSVRAVPGYINAGPTSTGAVFSVTKNDVITTSGTLLANVLVHANATETILGPWILNDGILLISSNAVNVLVQGMFGYETWPAIREQPVG